MLRHDRHRACPTTRARVRPLTKRGSGEPPPRASIVLVVGTSASTPIVPAMPASATLTRARGHQGVIGLSCPVVSSRVASAETAGFDGFVRYWTRLQTTRRLRPLGSQVHVDGSAVEAVAQALRTPVLCARASWAMSW